MAYAALPAKVAGETITLANYDNIRDNFAAGVPDLFTTKGDIAAATAADVATRLGVGADDTVLVADSGEATGLIWHIQPGARVYNSGDLDPATGQWVTLTFDSEREDHHGMHSVIANTGRLTVPADGDGSYCMGGTVHLDSSEQDHEASGLRVLLNGATPIAEDVMQRFLTGIGDISISITTAYPLVATDYVELQVWVDHNIDVLAMANFSPVFWAYWLRP